MHFAIILPHFATKRKKLQDFQKKIRKNEKQIRYNLQNLGHTRKLAITLYIDFMCFRCKPDQTKNRPFFEKQYFRKF